MLCPVLRADAGGPARDRTRPLGHQRQPALAARRILPRRLGAEGERFGQHCHLAPPRTRHDAQGHLKGLYVNQAQASRLEQRLPPKHSQCYSDIKRNMRLPCSCAMGDCKVAQLLGVNDVKSYPVGWGNYTASRGRFSDGTWIGLPHLSRFAIMKRASSQVALAELFRGLDTV